MTEFDWMEVDRWIFSLGGLLSVGLFCAVFLALLADRLAYIRKITLGIHALRAGHEDHRIPLEGNNELTELADAINYMSEARQQLAEKERSLAREKEQLIRTLSHDIRTPLTSVLAYSEYLAEGDSLPAQERKAGLQLIRRKAEQIRDLTALLLDGDRRNPEYFADARLLMEQLAAEFEEELEDASTLRTEACPGNAFGGTFDVRELRRIFDNLSSNVKKYADPAQPVCLTVRAEPGKLVIRQENALSPVTTREDSSKLGIHSIRRIAQNYGGTVTVEQDREKFAITVTLSVF